MRGGTWTDWLFRLGPTLALALLASLQLQAYGYVVRLGAPPRSALARILGPATARADVARSAFTMPAESPVTADPSPEPLAPPAAPTLAAAPGSPPRGQSTPPAATGVAPSAQPGAGSLAGLLKGVKVVPEQRDGKVVGLRLRGVRSNGLLGLIGLREGDRLDSINGYSVTEPNQMLALYVRIRQVERLSIAIERDGRPVTIEIKIV
jgi:hypothetical protein